jgi:hypothetical protein
MAPFRTATRAVSLGLVLALGAFAAQASNAWAQSDICDLRNKALADAGWVAGNSVDHYFWDQVLPYVGVNGIHTVELASVSCKDPQRANTDNGFSIYRSAFEEGRSQPFDEAASLARLQSIKEDTKRIKQSTMAAQ